jgi:DNA-directed RNA polymerase specialized sigma24 family protein
MDLDTPSSKLVATELTKPRVNVRLRQVARWHTRNDAQADDLVADSLVRVLEPEDRPWDPETRTFFTHMTQVIRQTWDQQKRSFYFRKISADGGVAADGLVNPSPSTDDAVDGARQLTILRALGDMVFDRLGDDDIGRKVFELSQLEDLDQAQLAARVPCSVDEIKAARKRLERHGDVVLREWNDGEQRRMNSVRESAMRSHEGEGP